MRQDKRDKECGGQGFGEAGIYKGWSEKTSDKLIFEQRSKEGERGSYRGCGRKSILGGWKVGVCWCVQGPARTSE